MEYYLATPERTGEIRVLRARMWPRRLRFGLWDDAHQGSSVSTIWTWMPS